MSSSKIFQKDKQFIRTSVVRLTFNHTEAENDIAGVSLADQEYAAHGGSPDAEQSEQSNILPGEEVEAQHPISEPVDLEAIRAEAYQQGMADQAALLEEQFTQVIQAFHQGCQDIDNLRPQLYQQGQQQLQQILTLFCRKLFVPELSKSSQVIAAVLQSAFDEAIASEEFQIRLHPDDLAAAEKKAPEIITAITGLEHIFFKPDSSITRGGCILESSLCQVDATVETRLENIEEFLATHPDVLNTETEPTLK